MRMRIHVWPDGVTNWSNFYVISPMLPPTTARSMIDHFFSRHERISLSLPVVCPSFPFCEGVCREE